MSAKYISIIHVAEDPKDGVQLCFRCGLELARSPLTFWQPGHRIGRQFNMETLQPTGGWGDLDAEECVGVEPEDIECVV